VGQDCFISDPIVAHVDNGFAVSARRVEGPDAGGELDIEIAHAEEAPSFERFDTTPLYVPVWIEIPRARTARWRGRLRASAGVYSIKLDYGQLDYGQLDNGQLDDGPLATLRIHDEQWGPALPRAIQRRVLTASPPAAEPVEAAPASLRLAWELPDGSFTCDMALAPTEPRVGSLRREGWLVLDPRGVEYARGTRTATWTWTWPQPAGGVRVHAVVLAAQGGDVVDLVAEWALSADEVRVPPETPPGADPRRSPLPSLTTSRVRVDSFRVWIPRGGEAAIGVKTASGRGGRLRLSFTPDP
jgi:hypothetical protein